MELCSWRRAVFFIFLTLVRVKIILMDVWDIEWYHLLLHGVRMSIWKKVFRRAKQLASNEETLFLGLKIICSDAMYVT